MNGIGNRDQTNEQIGAEPKEPIRFTGVVLGAKRHICAFFHSMEWALEDQQGVDDLVEYETRLNYLLPSYENSVICTYDLTKFGGATVVDVMRTHPVVIIGGILLENPFFLPPDEFLLDLRERRALDTRSEASAN